MGKGKAKRKPIPSPNETFLKGFYAGADSGVTQAALIACYVLRKEFGFGDVRLSRFFKGFEHAGDMVYYGESSFEEMKAELERDCGLELPLVVYGQRGN